MHPCGVIMDYIRSAFTTEMYLWGPDAAPVPVEWFFTKPGASTFPGESPFRSVCWSFDGLYRDPPELLGPQGAWRSGRTAVDYPADEAHGSEDVYLNGGRHGIDHAYMTDLDGAIPECHPFFMEMTGGEWQGGRTAQGQFPPFIMTGGEWQGGTAWQGQVVPYVMTGGEWQGGTTQQGEREPQEMTGGEWQGGVMHQGATFVQQMEGGEWQGGSAAQFGPPLYVMTGGEWQGGSTTQGQTIPQIMEGGEWQGGSTAQYGNPLQEMTGGEWQGGSTTQGAVDVYLMTGGEWQGGTAEQWHRCGPDVSYVDGSYAEDGLTVIELDVPGGLLPDDLLLLVTATAALDHAAITVPDPWTLVDSNQVSDGALVWAFNVHRCRASDAPDSPVIAESTTSHLWGAIVAFRGAGAMLPFHSADGVGNPATGPSIHPADDGNCMVMIAICSRMVGTCTNLSGMTVAQPPGFQCPFVVWYQTGLVYEDSGDKLANMDAGGPWAASTFLLSPCDP